MNQAFHPLSDASWVEEPVESEMDAVTALASRVSELKGLSLTRVGVSAEWYH
jgi:hypothetical protein